MVPDPIKSLSELRDAISAVPWFANLGDQRTSIYGLKITATEWSEMTMQNLAAQFGLPGELSKPALSELSEWLPTSPEEIDPIRGEELAVLEASLGKEAEAKEVRSRIARDTLKSLRNIHNHKLLKIGSVDYTIPAKGAANFAFRRASTELVLESPGFWTNLISIYMAGHWPFAVTSSNGVLVL